MATKKNPNPHKTLGRPTKYTEEVMNEYAKDVLEWASKEDSIVFAKWLSNHNQTYEWAWEMMEKYSIFSKAFKAAKLTVGTRREEMGLRNKINTGIVMKTMHNYDSSLLKTEKDLKSTEKPDDEKNITINLVDYSDENKDKKETPKE